MTYGDITQAGLPNLQLTLSKITEYIRELEVLYAMAGHLVADEDKAFSYWLIKSSELKKVELNLILNWNKRRAN